MRKSPLFSTVLTLFLLVPASITWAQTISSQKGLTTAIFSTPHGKIKVYLPDDIRPGDVISGTVVIEPIGKNTEQKAKHIAALKKYDLSIDGNKLAVSEKYEPFQWLVPVDRKQSAPLELLQIPVINKSQLPVFFNTQGTNRPATCQSPTFAIAGRPLVVNGPFDGDASNTRCQLDKDLLRSLAESPRKSIFEYTGNETGIKNLTVTDNTNDPGKKCEAQIPCIRLDVSAGKLKLMKGEKTYIDVRVTGLEAVKDTATLFLNNRTYDVVSLLPANHIVISFPPGSADVFSRRFDIQSKKAGGFEVDVDLNVPSETSGNVFFQFDLRDLKNESGYPGSYGYEGDKPCNPEGATIKVRWHKTFPCEIDARKVLPCGHSKEGNDVYEKIKELLEELELDKATDIGEKMAKAFSTAKTFSYSIHVIRRWVDYDVEYKCVNGRWQSTGGVYVTHGTDDLGWHSVKNLSTECWLTFTSGADEQEFEAAIEIALRNACK